MDWKDPFDKNKKILVIVLAVVLCVAIIVLAILLAGGNGQTDLPGGTGEDANQTTGTVSQNGTDSTQTTGENQSGDETTGPEPSSQPTKPVEVTYPTIDEPEGGWDDDELPGIPVIGGGDQPNNNGGENESGGNSGGSESGDNENSGNGDSESGGNSGGENGNGNENGGGYDLPEIPF